jgi:hypothetical protein
MKFHPLSEIFPLMTDEDMLPFRADIKKNGLGKHIVMYEGLILDGRNRWNACKAENVKPTFTTFTGTKAEAEAFVFSENLHRRHLTTSQRGMIAQNLASGKHGGDRKSDPKIKSSKDDLIGNDENQLISSAETDKFEEPIGKTTISEAAEKLKVSPKTVERAKIIATEGTKKQIADVESGNKTIGETVGEIKEKKAKKKQTRGGDELKDAIGVDVPERIRDVFGDQWLAGYLAQVDQWLLEIGAGKWITQLKGKSKRYAAYLRAGDALENLAKALESLNLMRESIAAGIPHAVCPGCKGEKGGCDDCRKTGWMPEWRYQEING